MNDRIVDLADAPARLSVRYENLVIAREGTGEVTIPLPELAVLVVSHPQVSFTHAVLAGLAAKGGMLVACNEKHMPAAMLLPLELHFTQAERFQRQAHASLPTRKRLWQQIVRAKVRAQARLLERVYREGGPLTLPSPHRGEGKNGPLTAPSREGGEGDGSGPLADARGSDNGAGENAVPTERATGGGARATNCVQGILELQDRVRSGDPQNVEAQAARRYWPALFGAEFKRDPDAEDQNRLLNYGYAVLRAITARAICAAGLHPSLGLHHHNRYDSFCLADDLMEPYRPLVDAVVVEYCRVHGTKAPLDKSAKAALIGPLLGRYAWHGEERTLADWLGRAASSLADVYVGIADKMVVPELEQPRMNADTRG